MRLSPVLGLFLAVIIPLSSAATVGIDNGTIALHFRDGDFGLERIDGAGFSLGFDAEYPLWIVEFYDPAADTLMPADLIPVGSHYDGSTSWELSASEDTLSLYWQDMDLAGQGTFDFAMRVILPIGEDTARLFAELSLDSDTLSVWAVNAPRWKLLEQYEGLHIDRAILPTHAGCLVKNPAQVLDADYSKADDLATEPGALKTTLPGGLSFQQLHFYDEFSERGLLFGTEDAAGWMKRIGNLGIPGEGVIQTRFRHILQHDGDTVLSWTQPYPVFVQPFSGDWIAGARVYRERVADMPWMDPGPLHQRNDLPENLLDIDYSIGFGFRSEDWPLEDVGLRYSEIRSFMGPTLRANTATRGWPWHRFMFEDGYVLPSYWRNLWSGLTEVDLNNAPYTSTRDLPFTLDQDAQDPRIARTYNGEPYHYQGFAWRLCPKSDWREDYPNRLTELVDIDGVTNLYLDNYPAPVLCYESHHDHPPGGGTWYIEGYQSMFQQIRQANPQAILSNESRCERFIPWLNIFPNKAWGRPSSNGWFALDEGEPIPLVSAVYNDRVTVTGSVSCEYELVDSTAYRFMQAWVWTNGQRQGVSLKNEPIEEWSEDHLASYEMVRDMLHLTARSPDHFLYGRWERPPTLSSFDTVVVEFPFEGNHQYYESAVVLGGTLIDPDDMPALLLANFAAAAQSGTVSIDLAEMGLLPGSWEVWKCHADGGVDSLDAFSGGLWQREMDFEPLEACVLLFTDSGGSTDLPDNSNGGPWELRVWPNPLRGSCSLVLEGLSDGASLGRTRIFDLRGRLVRDLGPGETWFWDGKDTKGCEVGSGIYFARTDIRGRDSRTTKMLVIR